MPTPKKSTNEDIPVREIAQRDALRDLVAYYASQNFYAYVRLMGPYVVPGFKDGTHIKLMCDELQKLYETPDDRLMIFLSPGSSKSKIGSLLFPSWVFGKESTTQVLHVAHTKDFIDIFGGQIRDFMSSQEYLAVFPHIKLNPNFGARDYWETTDMGVYRCSGVGGQIAGKRAMYAICDDLVSEQTYNSKIEMEAIYDWWPGGFESRLLEGARIVLINTRWGKMDPAEWLKARAAENPELDQWRIVSIPAILNMETAELLNKVAGFDKHKEGESYWPEVWHTKTLLKKKMGMPKSQWMALYMQTPIALDGNIIKVENFQTWKGAETPRFTTVIASLDTAFSTKSSADYSVCEIWGIFNGKRIDSQGIETKVNYAFLIDIIRGRFEYPDLLQVCSNVRNDYDPDVWVVEKKASGQSLIQDLRRRGYMVKEYTPDKDKKARAHAITPFVDDKRVWIPNRVWAKDFRDECASFSGKASEKNDQVDAFTQAMIYLRDSYSLVYDDEEAYDPDEVDYKATDTLGYWQS